MRRNVSTAPIEDIPLGEQIDSLPGQDNKEGREVVQKVEKKQEEKKEVPAEIEKKITSFIPIPKLFFSKSRNPLGYRSHSTVKDGLPKNTLA